MIDLEETDDVAPICPYCSRELKGVWVRQLRTLLGKRYIYFCKECRKVLGVSHRKGFWMG
jgi:hypothetical protein